MGESNDVDIPFKRYFYIQLFFNFIYEKQSFYSGGMAKSSQVFCIRIFRCSSPLLLIAIMTFVLITSSGTMALAVKYGYEKNKKMCGWFVLATAIGGLTL